MHARAHPLSSFTADYRLRLQADFQHVREHGVRVHCGAFIAQGALRKESAATHPRLGVVTSRRVGSAVVRNRARRLIREIFRRHKEELPAGTDLVIIMRSTFQRETFATLEARYLKACQRLNRELGDSNASR